MDANREKKYEKPWGMKGNRKYERKSQSILRPCQKQKDRDTMIGPFKVDKEYIYDTKEIYKFLIQQYNSQFSRGSKTSRIIDHEINDRSWWPRRY